MLENSCVCSKVPAEASYHFYQNNKMFNGINCYNTCSNALSALTQPHNRLASHLLHCRWYITRTWPRNPLFRCVKSLLLLWKPHSWF